MAIHSREEVANYKPVFLSGIELLRHEVQQDIEGLTGVPQCGHTFWPRPSHPRGLTALEAHNTFDDELEKFGEELCRAGYDVEIRRPHLLEWFPFVYTGPWLRAWTFKYR